MNKPKVSVIIPVYNVEKYLEECLDSVIYQTLREIEIICVDDGSTDDSGAILESYRKRDERMIVITTPNGGQSVARNIGVAHAEGEYICFLDSDDMLDKSVLLTLTIESDKNDLDMILFDATTFYETEELEKRLSRNYSRKNEISGVLTGPQMIDYLTQNKEYQASPCLYLSKKKHLDDKGIRFLEGIIHEDNAFTFQNLLNAKRISHRKITGYKRRIREASTVTLPISTKNLYGYFICYLQMSRDAVTAKMTDEETVGIRIVLSGVYSNLREHYLQLRKSGDVKAQFDSLEWMLFEKLMLQSVVPKDSVTTKDDVGQSNRTSKAGVKKVRISACRKVKSGFRCLKEHGISDTINELKKLLMKK